MERKATRYILAVRRGVRDFAAAMAALRDFPGIVIVSDSGQGVVAVEAPTSTMAAFRRHHGMQFLIEKPRERSIPDRPRIDALAVAGSHTV